MVIPFKWHFHHWDSIALILWCCFPLLRFSLSLWSQSTRTQHTFIWNCIVVQFELNGRAPYQNDVRAKSKWDECDSVVLKSIWMNSQEHSCTILRYTRVYISKTALTRLIKIKVRKKVQRNKMQPQLDFPIPARSPHSFVHFVRWSQHQTNESPERQPKHT